ncbi:MAG: exosome complex protein Rrp4 [Candidatus Micrarchaeia archaeon]
MEYRFVVPGELVFEEERLTPNTYKRNGKTYASIVGIFDGAKVVPLSGPYVPSIGDYVVGIIEDVKFVGYDVNINSPYTGFLHSKESSQEFELGMIIGAKVLSVDEVKSAILGSPSLLRGGSIIEISSAKIPRVIGKKNSMINMIRDMTGCDIVVGRNGRVWIKGEKSGLATLAILKIEREAHTSGLTDRVRRLLERVD